MTTIALNRRLHKFLTAPTSSSSRPLVIFWFSLSLTFAVIFALRTLLQTFNYEYVAHDDARQHVFWMLRFLDPELFPNDLFADYHQSVVPAGFTAFIRLMAAFGINPLLANKFLPVVLGLIATGYCFALCLQIFPVPAAGFIATLLLNQDLWTYQDLVSGTPRAFLYPLFLAFLYYLLRRSLLPCLVVIVLLGLFYPVPLLLAAGILILRLLDWGSWPLRLSRISVAGRDSVLRSDYLFCAVGLGVILLALLPSVLETSQFGPTLTASEAKALPELASQGRKIFFLDSPKSFWVCAARSGFLPTEWCGWPNRYFLLMFGIGLLLPLLLRYPTRFPLVKQITSNVTILPQLALVSLGWYLAAHAVLFKLYLPSRYMQHSLRIMMALMAGIVLIASLDAVFHACQQARLHRLNRRLLTLGATALLGVALVWQPFALQLMNYSVLQFNSYTIGKEPLLYQFIAQQRKDSLVASLSEEADNLPIYAKRSILIGSEFSNPYHMGYYRQFRQRLEDLIRAQYSLDWREVETFIQKYGVDFWLLDRAAFTPEYFANNPLLSQFLQPGFDRDRLVGLVTNTLGKLKQGRMPALASVVANCSVLETENVVVLQAKCIAKAPKE